MSGDPITFTVNASDLGSEFTVGATSGSPTAVSMQSFSDNSNAALLPILIATLLLLLAGGIVRRWHSA